MMMYQIRRSAKPPVSQFRSRINIKLLNIKLLNYSVHESTLNY